MSKPNVQLTQQEQVRTLRSFLEAPGVKSQIQAALPRGMGADRMLRQALTLCQTNPRLLECTQASVAGGIIRAAELALELSGPLGQAYLVPRKNRNVMEACFQVGYKGLIALAYRSAKLLCLSLRVVFQHDAFDIDYGSFQRITHKPLLSGPRGDVVGYYAAAELAGGGRDFEFLSLSEMRDFCARYRASNGEYSPWSTNFDEMALKTCARRLAKRLPLSVEFQQAAAEEEYHEAGVLAGPAVDLPALPARAEQVLQRLEGPAEEEAAGGPEEDPSVAEPAAQG